MSKEFIVKVQQSQYSSDHQNHMLIYNEKRDKQYQGELSPEVKKLLGSRPKAYFNAKMQGSQIALLNEVENQNW